MMLTEKWEEEEGEARSFLAGRARKRSKGKRGQFWKSESRNGHIKRQKRKKRTEGQSKHDK